MNTPYWFSNLAYWSAQVALLTLAAGFLPHVFKIRQPHVLLIYWRALIAVCLLLPFAQPWHRPENVGMISFAPRIGGFAPIVISTSAPAATPWHLPSASVIAQIIGLIILAGIAARFTILALGLLKLRQFRRASSPILEHATSSAVLDEMRVRVNTGGEFRISSDVDSPVTFGLSAPVILLPERFPTLDAQYQAAIACHELLHVRRCDWAHHLSEESLRAALWFHPAIAWLIARIRLSREQVVDLEVVKLTDARKPYLEALLEFTKSRALARAIPAPPFLVERQLAERVALMLKEVRMSRTRLIASLTAIAACLALVATLAVWTFPLKAAPRPKQNPPQGGIAQGVSGGVIGGVTDGVMVGVPGGVIGGVTGGVPGGIAGGAPTQGVKGGVPNGVKSSRYVSVKDPLTGRVIGEITLPDGPFGSSLFIRNTQPGSATAPQTLPPQQDDKSARDLALQTKRPATPVYPHEAIENHLEGRVNLTLTVNVEGKVSNVEFISGSSEFVQAATDAAFQWEFQPPAKAPAIMTASFDFTLSPSRGHAPFIEAPKDPRAVSGLNVAITAQDPSPQSAPASASFIDSHMVGNLHVEADEIELNRDSRHFDARGNVRAVFVPVGGSSAAKPIVPPAIVPASASASQSTSGVIYRAGENGVSMPVCEYCPKPEYSAEAREAGIQGMVYLQVAVLTNGRAGEIKLIRGVEKSLDEQAIKAVREQWTFKPATDRNGDAVDVLVPVEISFQLFGPPQPPPPSAGHPATLPEPPPASASLTSNDGFQTKIFTALVSDNGESTPFYMGLVKTQTLYAPRPEFPRLARQMNLHEGLVTLNIIVDTKGKVIAAEYVKSSNPVLVQEAIKTVRDWIIKGTHDGVPVTFQISVEVSFQTY